MMGDFLSRLDTFLIGSNQDIKPDGDILNRLFDFVTDLDPDQLTEEQADVLYEIIEDVDFDADDEEEEYYERGDEGEDGLDEEDLDEAPIKRRINKQVRRQRALKYRKNRAKVKQKAKKYRKTAKYKQLQKRAKMKARSGRTATGRRKVRYV
jgi:hypothetical protein